MQKNGMFNKFLAFSYGSVFAMAISIFSTPLLTRIYSPEEFGRVGLFNTVVNLIIAFGFLGLDQAFIRFYYKSEQKNELLRKCTFIPFLVVLVVVLIFILFSHKLSVFIFGEYNMIPLIMIILKIICIVPNRFSLQILRMEQKANTYSFVNILEKMIYVLIAGVGSIVSKSYIVIVFALSISYFLITIIASIYSLRIVNSKIIPIETCHLGKMNESISQEQLLRYSIPFVIHFVLFWIVQSYDRIAIRNYCTYTDLGIYTSAYVFATALSIIQVAFTSFWVPTALEEFEKRPSELNETFTNVANTLSMVMLIIMIIIGLGSSMFVRFLGEEYRVAEKLIPLIVIPPMFYVISESTSCGIMFKLRSSMHIIISFIGAVVCIILNLFLVPRFGIRGAAISTALAYFVILVIRTTVSERLFYIGYNYINVLVLPFLIFTISLINSMITNAILYYSIYLVTLICVLLHYRKIILSFFRRLRLKA